MPNTIKDNIKVGLKTVQTVRGDVPYSMNYESTSCAIKTASGQGIFNGGMNGTAAFANVHNQVVNKLQTANYTAFWKKSTNRTLVREIHNLVQTIDTGNCLELAFYTAHKLKEEGKAVDVVRVKPTNPAAQTNTNVVPHWFAVIGRRGGTHNNKSNIGLPSSWGNTAVVVDSWDKTVYPAADYNLYWNGLKAAAYNNPLTCELWVRI